MAAYFIACYPRPANGEYKFDLDYYLKTHMPMQLKAHAPHGMRSYHVITPNKESGFAIQTIEYWDNIERLKSAMEDSVGKGSMAHLEQDIKKYTDITNAFAIMGEIQGAYVDDKMTIETLAAKGRGF